MCDEYPVFILDWSALNKYISEFYEDKDEKDYIGWLIVKSGIIIHKKKVCTLFTTKQVSDMVYDVYGESNPMGVSSLFEATNIEGGVNSENHDDSCLRLYLLRTLEIRPVYLVTVNSKMKDICEKNKFKNLSPQQAVDMLEKFL